MPQRRICQSVITLKHFGGVEITLHRGGFETQLSSDIKVHIELRSDGVFVRCITGL